MAKTIAIWFAFACVAAGCYWLLIKSGYPFILASEEARKSLEVTTEQLAELKAARYASDAIAYGALAALLTLLCGTLVSQSPRLSGVARYSRLGRCAMIGVAVVIGFLAGAVGGWLANLFEDRIDLGLDPTTRLILRNSLVLIPGAIVAALLVCSLRLPLKQMPDMLLAGILGVGGSLLLSTLLQGTLTNFEARPPVFPDQPLNRLMFPSVYLGVTSLVILLQSYRLHPKEAVDSPKIDAL